MKKQRLLTQAIILIGSLFLVISLQASDSFSGETLDHTSIWGVCGENSQNFLIKKDDKLSIFKKSDISNADVKIISAKGNHFYGNLYAVSSNDLGRSFYRYQRPEVNKNDSSSYTNVLMGAMIPVLATLATALAVNFYNKHYVKDPEQEYSVGKAAAIVCLTTGVAAYVLMK